MHRRLALKTLTAIALCAGFSATAVAQDLTSATLRLKWLAQAQFAGFYVAVAKGYYKEEGIDLTINPGGPNLLTESLVASGADTFGLSGGTDSVMAARSKGLPIVSIGVAHQITPSVFVAKKDGPVKTIEDFKGKTVTTWFSGMQYVLQAVLTAEGIDPADVNMQPQQVSMTPFIEGQSDVATATRYNELYTVYQAIPPEEITTFVTEDYGVSFPRDTLIVNEETLADDPELVEGFLRASIKGWIYAFQNPEEAVDIVMEAAPTLNRDHQVYQLAEIKKLMLAGAVPENGLFYIDYDKIQSAHDLLVEGGMLPAPVDLKAAFVSGPLAAIPTEDKLP
ncbi:ABC transporter substrate-binding protein [Acuticoccus sediminis]|uniref:Thiamine pyrimidine synthase n=1 Tax=Acuticoccus sediminis TaxID=2184697 RepID=A0A8B2P1P6_9HYPH|nr:ABC transporter substrate-binding protein [Acuticoccus sediminis]RAI02197.1 ABC transporter substrate-binding protein [Acuticoccus sediminis]